MVEKASPNTIEHPRGPQTGFEIARGSIPAMVVIVVRSMG